MKLTEKTSSEKLARGSYFLTLSSIANMGMGALFWIILAKMVEPTSLGQVMVAIAFTLAVIGFSGHGVLIMTSKYISECNAKNMPNNSRAVFRLGLKIALIISGTAAAAIALFSQHIATVAYQDPTLSTLLIFAALTYLPTHTIVTALIGAFQGSQKMEYVLLVNVIFQVIRLASAVMLVVYGLNSFGILVGFALGSLVAALVGYTYLIPKVLPRISGGRQEASLGVRNVVKFSGLNYVDAGMRSVGIQVAVIILGTQDFGLAAFFGIAALISTMIGSVLAALANAMLPTASEAWAKGNKREFKMVFNTGVRISLVISGFGFLVLMVAPSEVLSLISESYTEATSALRILIVYAIASTMASITLSMLNAAGRPGLLARIGLISSGTMIALAVTLTPLFGLEGAAVAWLTGAVLSLGLSTVMLRRTEGLTLGFYSVIRPVISIVAGFAVGYFLLSMSDNVVIALIGTVLSYAGFSLLFRAITTGELKEMSSILLRSVRS